MLESAFCWDIASEGASKRLFTCVPEEQLVELLIEMAPFGDRATPPAEQSFGDIASAVFAANSFGVSDAGSSETFRDGADGGDAESRAVFLCICMANHSCAPTVRASQQQRPPGEPPVFALEARETIAAGEEITVAYLPRAWPRALRAEVCQTQWGFECHCARCSGPGGVDDTIVMRCGTCGDGRVYWTPAGIEALACLDCKSVGASCVPRLELWERRLDTATEATLPVLGGASQSRSSPQSLEAASTVLRLVLDRALMVGEVFDAPLPITVISSRLLRHSLLVPEDARVFGAISTLLSHLDPPSAEADTEASATRSAEAQVYEDVVSALAMASMRAPFVCPSDLGFDVEEAAAD